MGKSTFLQDFKAFAMKGHFESIGRCFDDWLHGALFIKLIDPADAGAVALDQTQAMEHLGKILVARL